MKRVRSIPRANMPAAHQNAVVYPWTVAASATSRGTPWCELR
jgi:hypothetical protein